MAISDNKKDLLLGQSIALTVKTIDDNFNTLFDNEADLETQISGKEPKFTKNTAFNKNFSTSAPVMDGTANAGSATTVARGDHKHPTDTSRLAVKPDGVNALLDSNNKVQSVYLPDSVLGQLSYQGTFNASTATSLSSLYKGDYYICSTSGAKNPDGTSASSGYLVGDWAVYNGTSWDKVDNTDAVTMINGQIGSVHTYKNAWSNGTTYYSGDIVLHTDSCLYLYINTAPSSGHAPTDTAYWKIFGKVYALATSSADGLMSSTDKEKLDTVERGAEVNQNAFSKVKVGTTTVNSASETDTVEIKAGTNVTVTADATAKSVTISAKDTTYGTATQSDNGLMSSGDKTKLDGIASKAEVNQNAFSNVKVGTTTVASKAKTDTVELVEGSNVTLSADASTKKVTITAKDTTYSPASSTADGLMSINDKLKLDGIALGAEVNQNAFGKVKVGSTTLTSGAEVDTVELIAGSNVTLETNAQNKSVTIKAKDTTYNVATESTNGLMSSTDKAKLNDIDSSLLGVTADDIGKVKDVTVDGVSVLDTTTGVAAITLSALKAGFVNITSSDSAWTDYTLNGTVYKAIRVEKTHTALGVFNSDKQQIVVQEVYDSNYLYLCVGTTAINCSLRVLSGSSANGGGSVKYLHNISVEALGETGGAGTVYYQVVNNRKTAYSKDDLRESFYYPGHNIACSGMFYYGGHTLLGYSVTYIQSNTYYLKVMAKQIDSNDSASFYSLNYTATDANVVDTVYEL